MTSHSSNGQYSEQTFRADEALKRKPISRRAAALRAAAVTLDNIEPGLRNVWTIKHWLAAGGMSVIYGPPGSAKTFCAIDMALHVAAGMDWHGHRTQQGQVVYLIGEPNGSGFVNRLAAFKLARPSVWAGAVGNFIIQPTSLDLCGPNDADAIVDWLVDIGTKPTLMVIDTLARAMGAGDESATKDMTAFVNNVTKLRERLGCHVLVVHHSGKDERLGARGSNALKGATDTEIVVRSSDDGTRTATVEKQRDGPTGLQLIYALQVVDLGVDEDGDTVSSCVVSPRQASAGGKRSGPTGDRRKFLEALQQYCDDHGQPNPGGTGWPRPGSRQIVKFDAFVDWAMGKSGAERDADKRKAVRAAVRELEANGLVQMNDGSIWIVPATGSERE